MAAREYYLGTQGVAAELQAQSQANLLQPQNSQFQHPPYPPQQFNSPSYANTSPPSYSAYPLQPPQNQQLGTYSPQPNGFAKGAPAMTAPYPTTSPAGLHFPPPPQKNGYLGAPIQPIRSHSQPPRVHFVEQESDHSTDNSSNSDSEASSRRRRHRRQHSHNRTRERDYDYDSDYSDRERDREHRSRSHRKGHKDRDTFLGAGAGGIIGDAIFPGLGTAAGLLLGGYGGRKYAGRSKSEEPSHHHKHRDGHRSDRY